ncbi:OPT oligopeptide transporter [Leucosporidium creatinivorum]|uniref:OPT oligopeptide transporter n=1 Tax=Leucosporidium creatinivorum TaxID=106004 RepID=A0A1Y2FWZ1_9BASI|nr:OPT oligopeptide transporter [Leucosporidium creatinivorum]
MDPDFYGEEEDSPFPEVRASVSNIDDMDIPCLTFRSIFLGLFFAIIVTALNVFFYFRYPSPFITPILVQVLAYPCGKFLAYLLPATEWRLPQWSRRFGCPEDFSFNPGPFNIKEHTVLVIIANIATGPAFALNFSVAAEKFYGVDLGAGFDILLILTTQIIGFGIAGLCRRFLVWPAAMIWPQNLVFCTLLNTLHAEDDDIDGGNGGLSRFKFLVWVFSGAFFWYFLPGFLFQALSAFSWVCWIAPNNVVVNQLFGVSTGLGMGLFTFDWSQIAYIGSPLVIPWWAQVNVFFGFFFAFWVIVPAMYYTNVWDSAYLPISSSSVYDRFGETYQTSAVVDTARMALNVTAYEEYSPLYLPITYATSYGLAFMLATSIIVHTAIYHGKEIMARVRSVKNSEDDIHMKLMREYPEVPDWWYMVFLVISVGMSIAAVAAWDTQMPVWSLIVSLIIGFLYILPGGFIYAMTNTQISVNLIIELVGGYIIPGLPFANMLFKVYAAQSVGVGLSFVQDLKLGHYMKIPPRTTFTIQISSTFIAAFVQVGVKRWLVATVEDFCDPQQAALLICPSARVFYSSSIIWGLVGPARQFGIGHLYNPILWWLLAGAIAPVVSWALTKRYPNTWVEYINVPVALTGAIFMPPATGINFSSWFLFGFVFQFLLRRRYYSVWAKFNFVLSAGLDAGTVCSAVFIFFTLMLPKGGTICEWGNNVFAETLDYNGVAYKPLPEEGFFGRSTW